MKRKRIKLPKNVVVQDGRLYFNKWFSNVRYNAAFGLVDSPANRRTAGHISAKINAEMKLGTFDPGNYPMFAGRYETPVSSSLPIFEDYVEQWLHEKELRVSEATYRTYRDLTKKHLTPYFGSMSVDQITKLVVQEWLRTITRKISRTYANDCLRRLKSIIYEAEADFDFNSRLNRVQRLKCYKVNSNKDEIFTLKEATGLYVVIACQFSPQLLGYEHSSGLIALGIGCFQNDLITDLAVIIDDVLDPQRGDFADT